MVLQSRRMFEPALSSRQSGFSMPQEFGHSTRMITMSETIVSTHLPDLQFNHRPRPSHLTLSHLRHHFSEPWFVVPFHYLSPTEKPHDPWAYFEGAEHDRHAPVFIDMRHGLASGARSIDVSRGIGGENGERGRGKTFRRDIDVRAGEGGGGREEDRLLKGLKIEDVSVGLFLRSGIGVG